MKETILVTGGCGFIGSTVSRHLLDKGFHVKIMDSFIRSGVELNLPLLEGAEVIRGDVRCEHDFDKIKGTVNWIYHCAANPGIKWSIDYPEFDFHTNAVGTLNALQFAKNKNASLVYCSTNKIYSGEAINNIALVEYGDRYEYVDAKYSDGIPPDFPIDGGNHSLYGVSKLAGDLLCQEYCKNMGVPTVVNRMSCISGPNAMGVEDQNWLTWFVLAQKLGQKVNIYGNGKQVRDVLAGEDLARLVELEFLNMDTLKGSVFNVGGGKNNTLSLLEAIHYIEQASGSTIPLEFHDWRVADQKCYISDTTKVCEEVGWAPTISPETLIDKIREWADSKPELIKFYKKQIIKA